MSTFTELDAFVTHVFRTKAGHVYGVTLNSGTLNVGDMIAITDNDDVWEVEVTQIRRYRESMATFGPAEALSYMGDARECGLVPRPSCWGRRAHPEHGRTALPCLRRHR